MNINKITPISYKGKLIRTQTFDKAVEAAKTEKLPLSMRYSFYNAIELLHDDFGVKSIEMNKIGTPSNQLKINAISSDGVSFPYSVSIDEAANEGISAVKTIINFMREYYGKRTYQYVTLSRKFDISQINEKIDSVLKCNKSRYMF